MDELNKRQINTIRLILTSHGTTAAAIARQLNVSVRTIYSDLKVIKPVFAQYDLRLEVIPRKGVEYSGSGNSVQHLLTAVGGVKKGVPNSDEERETYILTQLLRSSEYISMESLANELYVSRRMIERNLNAVENELNVHKLRLERKPSQGVRIIATEQQRRNLLFRMLNRYWGDNWQVSHSEGEWYHNASGTGPLLPEKMVQELMTITRKFADDNQIVFTDYAFQSLVIHLAIAIKRVEQGNPVENIDDYTNQMHGNMRGEAQRLAKTISQQMGVKLPQEEVAYIQLHLVAATGGKFVHGDISEQTSDSFLTEQLEPYGYDKELVSGLSVHMFSAIKRLKLKAAISNPYTQQVKQNYPQAFDEALDVADGFERKYQIQINDDEVAYIALHIEAYLERQRTNEHLLEVVLVCSTGLGSAQLLAAKVRREFPELTIKGVWSLRQFQESSLDSVDLIITTIRIEAPSVPTVLVPPIMQTEQVDLIRKYIAQIKSKRHTGHEDFFNLIDERLILVSNQATTWQGAIKQLSSKLIAEGYARDGIIQSAIQREQLSYTSFMEYAVPHADPDLIKKPAIAIGVYKKPIDWGEAQVKVVFFLAMTKTLRQRQIDRIFDDLYGLVEDTQAVVTLSLAGQAADVVDVLTGEIGNEN